MTSRDLLNHDHDHGFGGMSMHFPMLFQRLPTKSSAALIFGAMPAGWTRQNKLLHRCAIGVRRQGAQEERPHLHQLNHAACKRTGASEVYTLESERDLTHKQRS